MDSCGEERNGQLWRREKVTVLSRREKCTVERNVQLRGDKHT